MLKDVHQFDMFNTNNLWADLRAIQQLVAKDKLKLDLVIEQRELETAAGTKKTAVAFMTKVRPLATTTRTATTTTRHLPHSPPSTKPMCPFPLPQKQPNTQAAAAIRFFESPLILANTPRSRFMPVKTTADLFLVQSNLFALKNGILEMNAKRFPRSPPVINFGAFENGQGAKVKAKIKIKIKV